MKNLIRTAVLMLLLSPPPLAYAGVVMELVTTNASGEESDRARIYAQSNMIRMDEVGSKKIKASMIFLGDELLAVDHREKSYIVIDEAMLNKASTKINAAMAEMQAQLEGMSPDRRAMVEKMMKGRMQGMMGQQDDSPPAPRVEDMGSGEWQSYKCQQYAVFESDEKTQEVCAAELDEIEGGDEVIEAFRNMATYMSKMTESIPMMSRNRNNPGELMDQIDGFPVHAVDYKNGVAVGEVSLDSVTEQDLGPEMFAAPEGYQRQDPFRGR